MPVAAPKTLVLVGADKMGGAMLTGWLEGLDSSYQFHVIGPGAGVHLKELQTRLGDQASFVHYETADTLPPDLPVDVVVLATKPQLVSTALQSLSGHLQEGALVVCVAAGVGIRLAGNGAGGTITIRSGHTHHWETKHPHKRVVRLSKLRAPRTTRLPKLKPRNMKSRPANSRYE